jgi:hypothetical protein
MMVTSIREPGRLVVRAAQPATPPGKQVVNEMGDLDAKVARPPTPLSYREQATSIVSSR